MKAWMRSVLKHATELYLKTASASEQGFASGVARGRCNRLALLISSKRLLFALHEYPCNLHNHVHPRGLCKGRCQDCGGCNMGVDCTHFNASGGPIHPDPENKMSIPPCTRVSEDKTRCYRRRDGDLYVAIEEDFGQGDDIPLATQHQSSWSMLMSPRKTKSSTKPKTQKKKKKRSKRKKK